MDRIRMYRKKYRIISGKMINDVLANYRVFLFLILFICGMAAGSALIGRGGNLITDITGLIDSYKNVKISQSFAANFLNSLFSGTVFLAVTVFLAFSSIGAPLIAVIPFIRGAGMGMVCGYLYSTYKLTGLGYCLLLIYPGAAISIIAFLISCADSYAMSKSIMRVTFLSQKGSEQPNVRLYITRQMLMLCLVAASGIVDAAMTALFSSFFVFG